MAIRYFFILCLSHDLSSFHCLQQFLHIICRPRPHRRGAADHAVAVAIAMEVTAAGDQKAHTPRGQIQQGRGASGGRVVNLNAPQALLLPNAEQMAQQRAQARKAKNWAEADRLRDAIAAAGYLLEDTPQGPVLKKQ